MLKQLAHLGLCFKSVKPFPFLQKKYKAPIYYFATNSEFKPEVDPITIVHSLINKSLTNSDSFYDLINIYDRFFKIMTLSHYAVMVDRFNYLQKFTKTNPRLENHYNEILSVLIGKFERGEHQGDNEALTIVYKLVSRCPYDNAITRRCIFVLEQLCLRQYETMNEKEFGLFVTTLALNGKKTYFEYMLPHILKSIEKLHLPTLAKTLYAFVTFNIRKPEVASKMQNLFLNSSHINNLSVLHYAYVLKFFSMYPELTNKKLFDKFEIQLSFIHDKIYPKSFVLICEAMDAYEKPPVSWKFLKSLENRFIIIMRMMDSEDLLHVFRIHCLKLGYFNVIIEKLPLQLLKKPKIMENGCLIEVFFLIAERKMLRPHYMDTFTEIVLTYGIDNLNLSEFVKLLFIYHSVFDTRNVTFSEKAIEEITLYLRNRLNLFSFHDLELLLPTFVLLKPEEQKYLYIELHQRILAESDLLKSDKDLYFLSQINSIFSNSFPDLEDDKLIQKTIDLAFTIASNELEEKERGIKINILETLAKVLDLSAKRPLTTEYQNKRKNLFQIFEKLFIEHFKDIRKILQGLTENKLFIYMMAFYSSDERPTQETEGLLERALSTIDLKKISPNDKKFLNENTDFLKQSETSQLVPNSSPA